MDALLYCILRGEPNHLHLDERYINTRLMWQLWCIYLFCLTNPVTPILGLLVIVGVEVKVMQDHLEKNIRFHARAQGVKTLNTNTEQTLFMYLS